MIRRHFKTLGGPFFQSDQLSGVVPFLLTNEKSNVLGQWLKHLKLNSYFEKNAELLLQSFSQAIPSQQQHEKTTIEDPNSNTDENKTEHTKMAWIKENRIIGWDHPLRGQAKSSTLTTILLNIINACRCQHQDILFVDCNHATLVHLDKINLCKTFQISTKGSISQQELDFISTLFYHCQ
ncbi:hypothetical protein RFI_09353 [Reticulomyxa filosa]|uniref:Uncharacterized protein n=1 Tax=Reticulomyxa filosa TaxID=46433 RepID=X6NNB5_RETFI|nr:hypothetical protein RFI_09353 [Reticulomyxa filosa]|eukprot:ETO27780.1 hypothetical protein RFI_09353 [Reticulomyxa filosa]